MNVLRSSHAQIMPISRTHNQSDLERRLKILNQQLYGKNRVLETEGKSDLDVLKSRNPETKDSNLKKLHFSHLSNSDITYLKHDLTKITILTLLAIGIQLIFYFSNILNKVKLF